MNSKEFTAFLSKISHSNLKVIDKAIPKSDYISIDLSSSNTTLNSFDITNSSAWEKYIFEYLKKHEKKVAFGGYLEQRNLYKRSETFNQQNSETERNIHLGIDLWIAEKTPVIAAFDGVIHSFKDNKGLGNYGPTIILKHTVEQVIFYTLYGHLSRKSLEHIKVNQVVKQGQKIAELGSSEENGDYAPHLHFQIIRNIHDNYGDYPGVSALKDLDFYKSNCPNPNLVLKL